MVGKLAVAFGALALLAGCGSHEETSASSEQSTESGAERPKDVVVSLTCQASNGLAMAVSRCLAASGDNGAGRVKIDSGGRVEQFSSNELITEFQSQEERITLKQPFSFYAQANGSNAFVLHAELQQKSGRRIGEDEASEFGVISFDSDTL